jgi:VanZ family protein
MRPSRLPAPVRLGAFAVAVAVLLWLCLSPAGTLPAPTALGDKAEHALGWAVLTTIGLVLFPRRRLAISGFAVALGVVVEGLQGMMRLGRHSDWRDLLADLAGVALILLIAAARPRAARRLS